MSVFHKRSSSTNQQRMVNYSVRAQDYLVKQGLKTTDDISNAHAMASADATTNASFLQGDTSFLQRQSKLQTVDPFGPVQLPKVAGENQGHLR